MGPRANRTIAWDKEQPTARQATVHIRLALARESCDARAKRSLAESRSGERRPRLLPIAWLRAENEFYNLIFAEAYFVLWTKVAHNMGPRANRTIAWDKEQPTARQATVHIRLALARESCDARAKRSLAESHSDERRPRLLPYRLVASRK